MKKVEKRKKEGHKKKKRKTEKMKKKKERKKERKRKKVGKEKKKRCLSIGLFFRLAHGAAANQGARDLFSGYGAYF